MGSLFTHLEFSFIFSFDPRVGQVRTGAELCYVNCEDSGLILSVIFKLPYLLICVNFHVH